MAIDRKATVLLAVFFLLTIPAYHLISADNPLDPNSLESAVLETKSPLRSVAIDPVNRGRAPTLSFSPRERFEPNGRVTVFLRSEAGWVEVDKVELDKHLRTREVVLPEEMAGQAVRLRISRTGGGASHLDALTVAGATAAGLDERLTRKLGARDNDVVDVSEVEGRELEFRLPLRDQPVLELAGRIEAERISETPFLFPTENLYTEISADSAFYEYRLGSNPGLLTVDGSLGAEALPEPFFSENPTVGSGHPQAPTTGWVMNDDEYLYVAIDFAADNTMDGGKDYTAVHVKGAEGMKTFRVSTQETDWGTAGFEYTDTVGWEHKVYEFAIPLEELGLESGRAQGGAIELGFEAYGTAAAIGVYLARDENGADPDTGPSGTIFTFIVEYQDSSSNMPANQSRVWIDLDGDGETDTARGPTLFLRPPDRWFPSAIVAMVAVILVLMFARTNMARVGIALGVLLIVVIGCAQSGGGASSLTTQELYEMTLVDPPWVEGTDFKKDYSATVEIRALPETYHFEFMFTDSEDNPVPIHDENGDPIANSFELVIE